MRSPLEKARKNPESMKARILASARRIFGEYGFHGTTTRMIAKEVGIDISTLHYHWGDKNDLYEAVVIDVNNDLGQELFNVEKIVHDTSLEERMNISIDKMTDYLFDHPEVSNLVLLRFGRTRNEVDTDLKVPEFSGDIARSMGLTKDKKNPPPRAMMEVMTIMNAMHSFVSGENYFRPMLNLDRKKYIKMVKDTLKFILIPAFVLREGKTKKEDG
ncbi:MAG: TetR/AcrR family transcriptional regulator [Deltaproteobacteria bacterium HGW-Deltaproteobacteria-12]|jgi:AcrR family transcriptional regulator|nr:MAG: TetR/AcrR family transcriptional regulator [Deltaproteobacteria bacterium HGW-Deltaproteobacteria-12]